MSLAETSALYAELKAWIAQQEAFEKTAKKSAPLTSAQRKALEVLVAPLRALTPPPDVGDFDYVSLLTRYRQANPDGEELDFPWEDSPKKLPGGTTGKTCRVTISEARDDSEAPVESFPAVGYGIENGQDPPAFLNKKQAKRYAAKCAVEWLIKQSFMPANLRDVTFPKGHQPVRFVPATSNDSPDEDSDDDAADTPSPKPTTNGTTGPVDFKDESLPATQRVDALCRELAVNPPKYILDRSFGDGDRYFDGHPDFGLAQHDMPPELGHVTKVLGQDRAKLKIAELVLKHLMSEYRERQSLLEEVSMPLEGAAL